MNLVSLVRRFTEDWKNMGFKSFHIGVLLRIAIICVTITALVFLLVVERQYLAAIILTTVLITEIIELFRFTSIINRKLTHFLESIRYSDFSTSFTHDNKLGKSFKELNTSFNNVVEAFRKERGEKEEHLNYLNTVVQHVTTGLMSFDLDGNIGTPKVVTVIAETRSLLIFGKMPCIHCINFCHISSTSQINPPCKKGSGLVELGIEWLATIDPLSSTATARTLVAPQSNTITTCSFIFLFY